MIQRWKSLRHIFTPQMESPWLHSHAAVPIAENVVGDVFRFYFSSRDRFNRSHTSYVVVDLSEPSSIVGLSSEPVLKPGQLGTFDDSGAMACWLTKYNDQRFLYYIGWNLGITVPFRNSIGLAISSGNEPFVKYSSGPIIDRSLSEPHFAASCCVVPGEDFWRMWYLSCTEWRLYDGKPQHKYHIKYAESIDGIRWARNGIVAIDYANEQEYAISRPSVLKCHDRWRMWYSYRGESYRIGYAESSDGVKWARLDKNIVFERSAEGWDREMIEYPFVFEHKKRIYMLYNGNGFGATGFGIAVLED